MRITWGAGAVVAVLISIISNLFVLPFADTLNHVVSLMLLLVGLWTIVASIMILERKDRSYYGGWGVVLAVMSLFAYFQPTYALGFLLIAIVLLILVFTISGRGGKMLTTTKGPPAPAGGTPAAEEVNR